MRLARWVQPLTATLNKPVRISSVSLTCEASAPGEAFSFAAVEYALSTTTAVPMDTRRPGPPSRNVPQALVLEQLRRLVSSPQLAHSERLTRILRIVVVESLV